MKLLLAAEVFSTRTTSQSPGFGWAAALVNMTGASADRIGLQRPIYLEERAGSHGDHHPGRQREHHIRRQRNRPRQHQGNVGR